MARRFFRVAAVACMLVVGATKASAATITFDSLTELDAVTTQFAGVSFTNATVLTAGSILNENEFPPASGVNVIFDDGGPIRIDFLSPVASFGGFFTYGVTLTLSAFDSGDNLLGSVVSVFSSNMGESGELGSTPNEFLQLAFANMAYVTIAGDAFGGSFAADNLEITAPVPEPSTLALLGAGVATLVLLRRRRRTVDN